MRVEKIKFENDIATKRHVMTSCHSLVLVAISFSCLELAEISLHYTNFNNFSVIKSSSSAEHFVITHICNALLVLGKL